MSNHASLEKSNLDSTNSASRGDALRIVDQFKSVFKKMSSNTNVDTLVDSVYATEMIFEDCFHRLEGRSDFKYYCKEMYKNLGACDFSFHQDWVNDNDAVVHWTLTYNHKFLKFGKPICVDGMSLIKFKPDPSEQGAERIYYHRDFVDGGAMLYEHLPLIGTVIRQLKKRML